MVAYPGIGQGTSQDAILAVRIELLAAQRKSLWVGNLVCAAMTAIVAWQQTGSSAVIWWCVAHTVVMALRVMDAQRFHAAASKSLARQRRFLFTMCVFSALNGMIWGAALLLFLDVAYPMGFIFLVITVACVAVGGMPALTMFFPAYVTFAVPIVTALAVSLFLQDTYEAYLLSVLALAFGGVVLAFARNLARATTTSITMEREMARLLQEVSSAKERIEEISAGKSRFLAAISHDVSQPLYSAMLYLEALRNKGLSPEQCALLDKLETSTTSLNEMFNSMVEVARLEQGEVDSHETNFPIAKILRNLEDELRPLAEEKRLEFSVATATQAIVYSDSVLLARILRNLMHNAIKYTEAGFVRVELKRQGGDVCISVVDSGRGISKKEESLIFDEYRQVDNEERNYARGLGLGLSVVKKLVSLLGHKLEVRSVVGSGSTFTLRVEEGTMSARQRAAIDSAFVGSSISGLHVLVLEDDEGVRKGLNVLLRDWGCLVTAEDSLDALIHRAGAQSRPPDILITDFRLPGEHDGISASEHVRAAMDPDLPCIVVTGDGHDEVVRRVRLAGLYYLPKPVGPAELRAAIASSV